MTTFVVRPNELEFYYTDYYQRIWNSNSAIHLIKGIISLNSARCSPFIAAGKILGWYPIKLSDCAVKSIKKCQVLPKESSRDLPTWSEWAVSITLINHWRKFHGNFVVQLGDFSRISKGESNDCSLYNNSKIVSTTQFKFNLNSSSVLFQPNDSFQILRHY